MSQVNSIQKYLKQVLNVLTNDENLIIKHALAQNRCTLFLGVWGIYDKPYYDEKLSFLAKVMNWFTSEQSLAIIGIEGIDLMAMYVFYIIHIGAFACTFIIAYLEKYMAKQVSLTLGRTIYYYFTFSQILYLPSITYASQQLVCDRQHIQGRATDYCRSIPQIVNGIVLLVILLWHSYIQIYLHRNISLPVQNFLKRRHNYLIYFVVLIDYPIIMLKQVDDSIILIVVSVLKIISCALYFFDAYIFRPYHSMLNVFYLQGSLILLFWSILLLIHQIQPLNEDSLFYTIAIFSPLVGSNSKSLLLLRKFKLRDEDVLTYIDDLHETIESSNSDQSTYLKWIVYVMQHKFKCQNDSCLTHQLKDFEDTKEITNEIVKCLLLDILRRNEQKPPKSRRSMEEIYLNLIIYLMFECFSPLKAFIQIKTLELKAQNTSYFFQWIAPQIVEKLSYKTQQLQVLKFQHLLRDVDTEKLSIKEVRETEILQTKMLAKVIKVVDAKSKLWQHMIQGFPRIEDMQDEMMAVSLSIWDVKQLLFTSFKIDPIHVHKCLAPFNGMQLRVLSLVYSTVLNDYYGTFDIEHRLEEMQSFERNLPQDTILNTTLIEEKVLITQISLIKSRGLILNQNRATVGRFFGYNSVLDFSGISTIQQMMPTLISAQHNQFLENYIQRGFSKFFAMDQTVFFVDKNGYLNCSSIKTANLFETINDYIITAALLRTKQSQNFIMFDTNGRIMGISQGVFELLNDDTKVPISVTSMLDSFFMFFLFKNLLNDISEDKEEFLKVETNHIGSQKSYEVDNFQNMLQTSRSFQQFVETNDTLKFKRFESQKTGKTKGTSYFEKEDIVQGNGFTSEERISDKLFGFDIPLLNPSVRNQIQKFLHSEQKSKTIQTSENYQLLVRYTLQFQIYGDQKTGIPIFICNISEVKKYKSNKVNDTSNQHSSSFRKSDVNPELIDESIINDEASQIFELNASVLNQHAMKEVYISNEDSSLANKNNIAIGQISKNFNQLKELDNGQSDNKDQGINIQDCGEKMLNNLLSQLVSPRNHEEQILNPIIEPNESSNQDDQDDMDANKDSSQQEKFQQKRDIALVLVENKKNLQQNDVSLKQSSSGASDKTQNSIFTLLKTLQYRKSLPRSLAQIIFYNVLVCLTLITIVAVQLILISDNLNQLSLLLVQVRLPSTFNELYSHFVGYGQIDITRAYNMLDQSEYFVKRYHSVCADSRVHFSTLLSVMGQQFVQFQEKKESLRNLEIYRMTQNAMLLNKLDFLTYAVYFNQDTNILNDFIIDTDDEVRILTLVTLYNLKWNLPTQIKLMAELVDSISLEFQQTLDVNSNLYLILLLVEITLVILLVPLQISLWKEHLIYQQKIFLLISRAQQKDADTQIQKYQK